MARLPQGAVTSLFDPFAEKKSHWKLWLGILLIAAAVAAAWWLELIPEK
jgi:hypothetical protein